MEPNNLPNLAKLNIDYDSEPVSTIIVKDPDYFENIIEKEEIMEKEPWIFDKIVEDKKCTTCYKKNSERLAMEKQNIMKLINNNYQNYIENKMINKFKNIDFIDDDFKDIEYNFYDDNFV